MQFPESWLREFCNPPLSTEQLADVLTMGGFEVEEVRPVAPPFTQVVVGEIKQAEQHPNADRLRVCQVDVGQGALLSIVCGAPNARAGIKVPCALVGAELPPPDDEQGDGQPFKIKLGKLRGVESQGMLCSARELKLSEDHGGLLELPLETPVGQDVRQALKLDDAVFTLKLTPNLGHVLSVYGVARELSALTGAPLVTPSIPAVPVSTSAVLPVKISAPDLCGRFSGRIVQNVNTKAATPAWMVDRLARCGQRSVTALVDISNYVMFEYGRPTHIFDLDKIHGGLDVRWGRAGEQLKLLNGNTMTLDETVGVIADDVQVESLAGIMGGDATAVSDDTRNVYVEAAFWWPDAVAGRSRRFNFSTDAGHRFERGVDPDLTVSHIERITQLILDICGTPDTACGPVDDHKARMPAPKPVTLRVARAAKILGMPVTLAQCADVFGRLGLPFSEDAGALTVMPPAHRFDLCIEEDLIEEVARVVGYAQLPEALPLAPVKPRVLTESRRSAFAVRRLLADLGYLETINFSFVEEDWEQQLAGNADPVRLLNPIASQLSVMRSTLIGSLLQVIKRNLDRRADRVRVFEVGRVFRRDAGVATSDSSVRGVAQPMHVAAIAYGPADRQGWQGKQGPVDFHDVKGDVEALLSPLQPTFEPAGHPALHPGRSARVRLNGQVIGVVGELHPRWRQQWELPQAPVLFELDLDAVMQRHLPNAQAVPRHPSVERDIAVVVPEAVTHAQLMRSVHAAPTDGLLRGATLFDIYRPKAGAETAAGMSAQEKSLAVRLALGSPHETLTDERIDLAVNAVIERLQTDVGARLRA
ncbi:phenylalanine--tRNA ligase subunit beta [Ottowia testudinis]|uniref:Phenylalanine--tRNA ligase beta subunit n=1 Tax=Ottowia testudinis TaxID=2816950 RepID=A0A975H2A2_9BURK|nr:phenylalanine--tRNA ligase subunit beta [Ottowia testudinis]QTD43965.1 phenylalanine--tRNA ligase subunit beta [Ottowia testudinis]